MALKDSYFTLSEAAKELSVTRQTVARWVSEDDITAEKVGRETLIHKSELERFKSDRRITGQMGSLITVMIDYIRDKYRYSENDKIDFFRFNTKKAAFWFYAEKQDEVYEVVTITIDKPKRIARSESNARFVVGLEFPFLNIRRQRCNKAQLNHMIDKYLKEGKSKRRKQQRGVVR